MQALPFRYDRELSSEQNNIALFDLVAAVSASGITEISRKQFEGRGGRFLTFNPSGSFTAVFLEVAFDNPDGAYFQLSPGSFIDTSPYKWSRLYVRVIPIQPTSQYTGTLLYLGQLIAADHFVVDFKGANPSTALYIHQPQFIASAGWDGNTAPFIINPYTSRVAGGAGNYNDYISTQVWGVGLDSRDISIEVEIKNTGAGTLFIYVASDGGGALASGLAPTAASQLYPLSAGEKETFYLSCDYASSHNIAANLVIGSGVEFNNMYVFSDVPGASYAWKLKEYR